MPLKDVLSGSEKVAQQLKALAVLWFSGPTLGFITACESSSRRVNVHTHIWPL